MESTSDPDKRLEIARTVNIVRYTWDQIKALEAEGKEYPCRDHVRLLTSDSLPALKSQSLAQRLRKQPRRREASVEGTMRPVSLVSPHSDEAGIFNADGVAASELTSDIVISTGYGPCTFIAGFREGKGFLTHNLAKGSDRFSVRAALDRIGIQPGATDVELYIGAGLSGGTLGAGGSGSVRRSSEKALREYRLPFTDVGGQSFASMGSGWKSTSVLIDPQQKLLLIIGTGTETPSER